MKILLKYASAFSPRASINHDDEAPSPTHPVQSIFDQRIHVFVEQGMDLTSHSASAMLVLRGFIFHIFLE
jgi:hypothetical protein